MKDNPKTASVGMLDSLVRLHAAARESLRQALDKAYPAGTRVSYMRSSRQVNPSFGVVTRCAVDNHPYVIIRGDSGKMKTAWIGLESVITKPNSVLDRNDLPNTEKGNQ